MKRVLKKAAAALLAVGMLVSGGSIFSGLTLQAEAADNVVDRIDITGFTFPVAGEEPDTEIEVHTNCGDEFGLRQYVSWTYNYYRVGEIDALEYGVICAPDKYLPEQDYALHIGLSNYDSLLFNHRYLGQKLTVTVNGVDVSDFIHDATPAYYPDDDDSPDNERGDRYTIDLFLGPYYPRQIPENSTVEGARLSLNEAIGVKFFVNPSADAAKAELTGPNGTIVYDKLLLNPNYMHDADYENIREVEPKGLYCLSYDVYPTQVSEPITLKLLDSQDNPVPLYNSKGNPIADNMLTYSVNDYIDGYYALHPDARENYVYTKDYTCPDYEDERAPEQLEAGLIVAMEQYFKALSNYFDKTSLALEGIQDVSEDDFNDYEPMLFGRMMSLVMDSKMAIKVYDESAETNASLVYERDNWILGRFVKENNYFCIPDIRPHKLSEKRFFKIGNDRLEFSALSYGWLAMHKSTNTDLQAVAKTMYVYAKMSEDYYNYYAKLHQSIRDEKYNW